MPTPTLPPTLQPAAPASRGAKLALLAAFLGWLFDGMEMGIFPLVAKPALTSMAKASGVTSEAGLKSAVDSGMALVTCFFLVGAAAGGVVFGWLGDRIGRVRAMTWSILCYSLLTGLCFLAQSPLQLGFLRFIAALGMGGEWALGVALVMESWPDNKRPWLAGAIGAAANLGYVFVALLGLVWKVTETSWRPFMLIGAVPAVLTFLIRLFVPESEKWTASVKGQSGSPLREIWAPGLRKHTLLGIVFASIPLIVTWGIVQWIPIWAEHLTGGGDPRIKAKAQLACFIGATLGSGLAPLFGNWLGRRVTYAGLCLISLAMAQWLFRGQETVNAEFFLATGVVGFFTAAFYGWLPLYLPELFPTRMRATGQGLAFNAGRLIAAVGVWQMPAIIALAGGSHAQAGAAIVFIYVLGAALIWLAPETKGKPLPE